jgi:hypothetical protein
VRPLEAKFPQDVNSPGAVPPVEHDRELRDSAIPFGRDEPSLDENAHLIDRADGQVAIEREALVGAKNIVWYAEAKHDLSHLVRFRFPWRKIWHAAPKSRPSRHANHAHRSVLRRK